MADAMPWPDMLRAAAVEAATTPKIADDNLRKSLATWLEGAALDAAEIGPDHRAVEFARVLLGVSDGG